MPTIRRVKDMSWHEQREHVAAEVRKALREGTRDLAQDLINKVETELTPEMSRQDLINKVHEVVERTAHELIRTAPARRGDPFLS